MPLWREYLAFLASELSKFNLAATLAVHKKCIEQFAQRQDAAITSRDLSVDPGAGERALLAVFADTCFMLRDGGFTEKGVACFQGLVELACRAPSELAAPTHTGRKVSFTLL